jgi:glycosyltransferase involved in cell wall biosynthesis
MDSKLLFVIPSLGTGGAELQTINQINHIARKSLREVYFASLSRKVDNINKLILPKERTIIVEGYDETTLVAGALKKIQLPIRNLLKFIRAEKINVVIAVSPLSHFVMRIVKIFNVLSSGRNIQLICYYRDVYYDVSPPDTFLKKCFDRFNFFLARIADDKTLFISKAVFSNIEKNFFVKNPLVLPNSLPLREISETMATNYLLEKNIFTKGKYFILLPGRLHFKKGHCFFIHAFKKFLDITGHSSASFYIFIAGEGPERRSIEAVVKETGLENSFFLNGNTENDLLLSLYKVADLVVIPSFYEGFGNVAIEGLMQQSLILSSDSGGLDEIIQHEQNGFKF